MNRRELLHLGAASALTTLVPAVGGAAPSESPAAVARFDLFEVSLHADTAGNPFRDVRLSAIFKLEHREIAVEGFCDAEATFRVRFMPDTEGTWTFRTLSDAPALDGRTGGFECVAARSGEPYLAVRFRHV